MGKNIYKFGIKSKLSKFEIRESTHGFRKQLTNTYNDNFMFMLISVEVKINGLYVEYDFVFGRCK